jgi:hypothetical protein
MMVTSRPTIGTLLLPSFVEQNLSRLDYPPFRSTLKH